MSIQEKSPATIGTGKGMHTRHSKGTHYDQLTKVYDSFFHKPQTMKEVDKSVGIMRENICWYCRTLRKQDQLFVVEKRLCSVTNHLATVFTTNPALSPNSDGVQLSLFDQKERSTK